MPILGSLVDMFKHGGSPPPKKKDDITEENKEHESSSSAENEEESELEQGSAMEQEDSQQSKGVDNQQESPQKKKEQVDSDTSLANNTMQTETLLDKEKDMQDTELATPRTLSKARREEEREARLTQDGGFRPASVPRKKADGTFARPAGRAPAGMQWDATQGLYVSPVKQTSQEALPTTPAKASHDKAPEQEDSQETAKDNNEDHDVDTRNTMKTSPNAANAVQPENGLDSPLEYGDNQRQYCLVEMRREQETGKHLETFATLALAEKKTNISKQTIYQGAYKVMGK